MISCSDASLADIYSHCIGIDGKPIKVTYRMSKSNHDNEPLLEGYVDIGGEPVKVTYRISKSNHDDEPSLEGYIAPWLRIRNKKKVGIFKMKKNTY